MQNDNQTGVKPINALDELAQRNIQLLIERGVFQVRKGQVVISFNNEQVITNIRIDSEIYTRRLDR